MPAMLIGFTSSALAQWLPKGPSPIVEAPSTSVSTLIKGIMYDEGSSNPASGAVMGLLQSSSNVNELYAGTVNGGVWKSSNGGS